jgi:hypothetical protein
LLHAAPEDLERLFALRELPDTALQFLSELSDEGCIQPLYHIGQHTTSPITFKNLVRLLVAWDHGEYFRQVLPPPFSLVQRDLAGVSFHEIDLSGYVWEGTKINGATFNACDLSGCDLSRASFRDLHISNCTLTLTNFGEPSPAVRVILDGEELTGDRLKDRLLPRGAIVFGARGAELAVESTEFECDALLREILGKVLEGDRPDNTRITRKKPATFERGAVSSRYNLFVRSKALPILLKHGVLVKTADRHGTLTLHRSKVGEVVRFMFQNVLSQDLAQALEEMREEWRGRMA